MTRIGSAALWSGALLLSAAAAWSGWPAGSASPASAAPTAGGDPASAPPPHTRAGSVLVSLMRGERAPRSAEIHVTTIFRERSFVLSADSGAAGASEEDLADQARAIFSLRAVDPIGSSVLPLAGGAALLEESGRGAEVRIEGRRAGHGTVRLVVTLRRDGGEPVSTSVVAPIGRTVVLAGPEAVRGESSILLVCLTALPDAEPPAAPRPLPAIIEPRRLTRSRPLPGPPRSCRGSGRSRGAA